MSWKVILIDDEITLVYPKIQKGLGVPFRDHLSLFPFAQQAIQALNADNDKTIKVVLLDLQLNRPDSPNEPQVLDGTKLEGTKGGEIIAERIKRIRQDVFIIAITKFTTASPYIDAYYPKEVLFASPQLFQSLREQIWGVVRGNLIEMYCPEDRMGIEWNKRWVDKYLMKRESAEFHTFNDSIGGEAKDDFQKLLNGQITGTYRRYRGTKNLRDVLIARRVLFATALSHIKGSDINWDEVCRFLGFVDTYGEPLTANLTNYMHTLGILWGSIVNGGTMLPEEREWIEQMRGAGLIP